MHLWYPATQSSIFSKFDRLVCLIILRGVCFIWAWLHPNAWFVAGWVKSFGGRAATVRTVVMYFFRLAYRLTVDMGVFFD